MKKKDIVNWIDIKNEMETINGWKDKSQIKDFNFIDVFSGAGGLSCGLVMAGMNPIATVEIDKHAVETYKYNFIEQKGFDEEVCSRDICNEEVKQDLVNKVSGKHIHLITGGFPCQGFSMAGKRVVTDPRNSLYLELLDIVNRIKPDYILMENVVGLRSMAKGAIEAKILSDFKDIGYDVNITVLCAADYGVAQTRKRVIFIGNRIGKTNYHPEPFLSSYLSIKDVIEKYMDIEENPEINHVFAKTTAPVMERIKNMAIGSVISKNYNAGPKKIHWDKPSPTVTTGAGNIHPIKNRYFTARELACFQSFPEDFIFKGPIGKQKRQIGNAVPCLLGKAIGLAILKSYYEEK